MTRSSLIAAIAVAVLMSIIALPADAQCTGKETAAALGGPLDRDSDADGIVTFSWSPSSMPLASDTLFFGTSGKATPTSCTKSPCTLPKIAAGQYEWFVRSTLGTCTLNSVPRTLTVPACPTISVAPSTGFAVVGQPFSDGFAASGGAAPYSYVAAGLPAWLTSSGSKISGTPTAVGNFSFTITATDANGCTGSVGYTVRVSCATLTIAPSAGSAIVGQPFSDGFAASGGAAPYTYVAAGLPTWLTPTGSKISGTPTAVGNFSFTITATDANGCTGSVGYTLRVSCPTLTLPASLANGAVGAPYRATLTTAGGAASATYTYGATGLPTWLTLSGDTLSGTPTAPGSFTFTITSTDANKCPVSRGYTITVPCPPLIVGPAAIPPGTVGVVYKAGFTATGAAPHTWSVSAGLPPGVTLSGDNLTGAPSKEGTYTFTVSARDANGCVGSNAYSIKVDCPSIILSPGTLPKGTRDKAYTAGFAATGGTPPYAYAISGNLPPGVTISGSTLSGVPTAAGQFTFTVTVRDANGCGTSGAYAIVVDAPSCPTLILSPASVPEATVETNYKVGFAASGGLAPYTYSMGGAVPGLGLSGDTLSGTPTTPGTFSFTITASDANKCSASAGYSLNVKGKACPSIAVAPASIGEAKVGSAFKAGFIATGGAAPYTFALTGSVPAGLSFSGDTLSGTPTAAGTYAFNITATDANRCTGSRSYALVVAPAGCPTISIAPDALTAGTVGTAYRAGFAATGGTAPYSYSATGVPAGFSFSGETLSGSPNTAGSFTITITASDANKCTGARTYSLIVNPAACPTGKPALGAPANGSEVKLPVTLSWSAVNGATGYRVLALAPRAAPTHLGTTTATTLTVGSLPQGETEWWVEAQFEKCAPTESVHARFTVVVALTTCPTKAPAVLTPANGAATAENPVKFTWTAVEGALKYNIYASLNGAAASIIGSSTTTVAALAVPDGASIEWFVEAIFDAGCPATRSPAARFSTVKAALCPTNPAAPTLLLPANNANVTAPLTLSWNPATGATSYRVHASLNNGSPIILGPTTDTKIESTFPAGIVAWQVEALFAGCTSTFSTRFSFTVSGATICSNLPATLSAPANGAEIQSPVTFAWSAVKNAATYRLFVAAAVGFEQIAEIRETSFTRIVPPGSFSWYVETTFLGCDALKSATSRFTVIDPKKCPDASIALQTPAAGASVSSPVAFSWSAVPNATSYRLWVGIESAPAMVFKGTATSATIALPSGTGEWYVDAQLPDCPSVVSPRSKFVVQRAATCDSNQRPTLLAPLSGTVSNPVTLRWNGSSTAVSYRLWMAFNDQPFGDVGITREATTTRDLPAGRWSWYVESLFENCPPLASNEKGSFTIAEQTPRCSTEAPAPISPVNGATNVLSPVTFVWTSVPNADAYRVFASKEVSDYQLIGQTIDTSLARTIPPGTFVWYVEAVFKGCSSTTSSKSRFTVAAATNCSTDRPQTISPRDGAEEIASPVTFAWSSISGANRYALFARGENGSPTIIGETTDTTLTAKMPPIEIEWWVVAFRAGCDPVESNHSTFRVAAPPSCESKAPVLLSPADGATNLTSPVAFSWTPSPRARAYRLFVAAGSNSHGLLLTTSETRASAPIPLGSFSWYVEVVFDNNCAPLQSAIANFSVGQAPTGCRAPEPPAIAVAGQVLSGTQYTVRWSLAANASAYELQESSKRDDFSGASTTVVNNTFSSFAYDATGSPIQKFYRVRAVSSCSDERGAYSHVIGIFIVPTNTLDTQARGTIEQGMSNTPVQTMVLPASPTPISFNATTDRPWLHVSPSSGTIHTEPVTLSITADPDALAVGANSGTVIVTYGASGKGASQASTPPPASVPVSVSLVTPVGPGGKNTPPPDSLIIPAVAHAPGANNALFQSDVRVANTSTQTMKYLLNFTPSGTDGTVTGSSTNIQIEPGATAALDDILASFFGSGTNGSASGVLEIRPLSVTSSSTSLSTSSSLASATVASSRTYNVTSTGTFGQFIPAVAFSKFIGKPTDGSRAVLSLQQIAQSSAYRTNLGLVEAAGEPAEVRVTVFDKSNAIVGEIPISLQPAEHKQINSFLAVNNISLEDGRFEVEVTSETGRVTAYASTIDNISNDPLLVSPVLKSAVGGTRYVIPGVASLDGVAKWRTDIRLYNTSSNAVNTTLTFYPQGGAAPQISTVTLDPGETRAFDNVLRNQFGLTDSNLGGSVLVTTQAQSSIVATARTYAETSNGTYGQFIPAVTPDEGVGLGGRSLHLIQLEQSAAYRTNIGLVETTGREVTAEVTLVLPDSKLTPKVPITLSPNGFVQFSLNQFNVGNAAYNARVSIRVTSGQGKVSAYGSIIDNRTQDPTYVPAQ